ncbi:sigma 54 modulation/S30EA ribosomal C-terminal domain-containing protein [Kribbella sp. CA-245084]|uniref:sigma 54 modulation/S30EA ribosomal C-terminal domain-containing protein n=1 Tax=Kribbella sp. CA-245084 TaxID=3239940 RepID=UPI003D922208
MSTERHFALPQGPKAMIAVSIRGILPTDAAAAVQQHLAPILGPVAPHSRVRLTRLAEPELTRPLLAQVDVQLGGGRRIRAQVAAGTVSEVVGRLAKRTIEQLCLFPNVLSERLRARVGAAMPPSLPELLPPPGRRVVRHKLCHPETMTAAEAIAELQALDYRFHLFREKYSRQDSMVIRDGSGRYRIIQYDRIRSVSPSPRHRSCSLRRSVAASRSRLPGLT